MTNFTYSQNGFNLTRDAEGLVLTAYQDPAGIWTIGYGHTGRSVVEGLTITAEQADALLASDVAGTVAFINQAVTAPINQNHFDALVDFTFNIGRAAFLSSTLFRLLNQSDFAGAAGQFPRWNLANHVVLPGLVERRAAEKLLFETPWQQPQPAAV